MSAIGLFRQKSEALPAPRPRELNREKSTLSEDAFTELLCLERKRAERSGRKFALMLVESSAPVEGDRARRARDLMKALSKLARETDIVGWYQGDSVAGVILTEFGGQELSHALSCIRIRLTDGLHQALPATERSSIRIAFHIFPDQWEVHGNDRAADKALYPDLAASDGSTLQRVMKRAFDIVGSSAILLLISPLCLCIAIAIRLTSKGPVLYRQQRLGMFGTVFTMYKFRSMHQHAKSDSHEAFVHEFITGKMKAPGEQGLFKISNDPRVTAVGRILRKTSMDELPQFFNVLRGDMSLVGPRPPIPYELKSYEAWHRRRLLDAKPGLTGLWQVSGRSRTCFNDMVRLDLRYARMQSVWLDLSLLFRTARVIFSDPSAS